MPLQQNPLTASFQQFFESERAGGALLAGCALLALLVANSPAGEPFLAFWQRYAGGLSIEHWVNDGLMAAFFLLVGLELKRELTNGELSSVRKAMLPVVAAAGGVAVPAAIHYAFNAGTPTQAGIGIPMATDIVFALAALGLLGARVPPSLKVFLAALAVADDLVAIVVIAVFYTSQLSLPYLGGAAAVLAALLAMNRVGKVVALPPYLLGGALLWFCMLQSGVHATLAGVLLAFVIPASSRADDGHSPSHRLEHALHKPVTLLIVPVFALANAGVVIGAGALASLATSNSIGIIAGLVLGKPLGIAALSFAAVTAGLCRLPDDLRWAHIAGAGMLAGIGFTMSIFITNLAFAGAGETVNAAKMAIVVASCAAAAFGVAWLAWVTARRRS